MVRQHHWLSGHEFEQIPGDSEGQGSLACCSLWGRKESDRTYWQNNNNKSFKYKHWIISLFHLNPYMALWCTEHVKETLSSRCASSQVTITQNSQWHCLVSFSPNPVTPGLARPPQGYSALSSAQPAPSTHPSCWRLKSQPQKSSPISHSLNEAWLLSSITITVYVCEEYSSDGFFKLHGAKTLCLPWISRAKPVLRNGCVLLHLGRLP